MLLWVFFLIVSLFLGISISYLLKFDFFPGERAFFSLLIGHVISIWIVFLLSYLRKSLDIEVIILCIIICALVSVIFFRKTHILKSFFDKTFLSSKERFIDKYALFFFVFILVYLIAMNLYGVFHPDAAGNVWAFHTVWADYPFHTSVISSFVYKNNFPPSYPQFLHTEMHYPFLMDFYSAILMKGGLGLRNSIIIPNVLFQLSFFGGLYFLSYRLTGLKKVGLLSTFIFIFSGFPSGLKSFGIHFLNPMYAVIMPQRTAILGMAISFVVYILLFQVFMKEKENPLEARKELILAGILIGLLPFIHAHSFMVTSFVSLFLFCFTLIKNPFKKSVYGKMLRKRDFKIFIYLFVPIIILSLPQILSIGTQVSKDFFVFFPGWTEENRNMMLAFDWASISAIISFWKTIFISAKFWLLNLGILFILLPVGFLKSKREVKFFYLPFLFLFVIANIIKFQPWYFDNYKIFLHWYALTIVISSAAVFWISDFIGRRHKGLYALSFASLIILCSFFGVVTHVGMIENDCMVWSHGDLEIASWARDNTVPESTFLTGDAHNHPIPALSGRQIVMGYEGWLWSQGLDGSKIKEVKRDEIEMYKGNYTLIKEYGVDYVCVGPYEMAFATNNGFKINHTAFNNEKLYSLKYDKIGEEKEKWRIYKVR